MLRLKRSLNFFDATALAIGAIIGAGIFVISGVATGLAGPAVILSILIAGAISALTAYSYVRLSQKYSQEGSLYVYAEKTISPFSGFITGWIWIFENMVAAAAVSLGLGSYVTALYPQFSSVYVAVFAVVLLTLINLVGIKMSSVFNGILVVLKIIALTLFIVIGFSHLDFSLYHPFMPLGINGVLNGAALIFFAFIGFGRPSSAAEEIKDPKKTVPNSIILALLLSAVIYVLVGIVTVGLIPYQQMAASASPIADAVDYGIKISWLKVLVSFAAIIATMSVLLTTLIGVSRVSFAMARNNSLPQIFNRIHKKFKTPYAAVLITGFVAAVLPFFGSLKQIATVTNFGSLFAYAMVNLSAIMLLRKEKVRFKDHPVKKTIHVLVPLLGFISCVGLTFYLDLTAWIIGTAWILVGAAYYLFRRG